MSTPVNTRPRMPLIVIIGLLWAAVVDIPTNIRGGPVSASGLATLGLAAVLVLMAPLVIATQGRAHPPLGFAKGKEPYLLGRFEESSLPAPLVVFVVAAIGLLAAKPNADGLQNVAVYILFVASIPFSAGLCSAGTAENTLAWFRKVAILVGVVTATQSLLGFELFGPRSAALTLVVLVGITAALPVRHWFDRLLPFLMVGACALTLSRTAMFVAVILIPISYMLISKRNGIFKGVAVSIPLAYLLYILVTTWAPLRDRFLQGDAAYSAGGLDFNTSGRVVLWEMTTKSWSEAPILGKGPGSASELISARFDQIAHPHNEYLRILHDFGVVGLIPFIIGLLLILRMTWVRARRLPEPIHKAAVLSLIGVLAVATTDNVLVYPFVMVPVGVLIGLSLAYPSPKATSPQRRKTSQNLGSVPRLSVTAV